MGDVSTRKGPPANPPSDIQTQTNAILFDPKLVVPDQPLYVQRNDHILLVVQTNTNPITLVVTYRYLVPEGEIKEGQSITVLTTPQTLVEFSIFEGWLLSFTARIVPPAAAGQWCFLQAIIVRGFIGAAGLSQNGLFWQGYIPGSTVNGWPGTPAKEISDGAGFLRTIVGTVPAAGAEISELVPATRRWQLLSLRATLTASATVANRFVGFQTDDGANIPFSSRSSVAQVAGAAIAYSLIPGQPFYNDTTGNMIIPAPVLTQIKSAYHLRSSTINIQVGDQWSAPIYEIIEWGQWDS